MIDIFELKKSSILEDENIKKYFNENYLKTITENQDQEKIKQIKSTIDFRKVNEFEFLNQNHYNDILPLLNNNTEIFNEKNWIKHIQHIFYYNRYLQQNKTFAIKHLSYNYQNIFNIQEFYTILKKHYNTILIKDNINPFKNLSKLLKKQGHFILSLYDNIDSTKLYKYKIPYNILTEGDLLNLCVIRLKELLIYIYPNLKDILTPNKEDEKYKRFKTDGTETNKLKEQNINDEMIIKYLLPFINSARFKDIYKIKSLDELYTTKINDKVDEKHQQPINSYYYTNYICDHTLSISKEDPFFKQSEKTYFNKDAKNGIVYYSFNVDDFILNANAIFKTIIYTENKMYVNWINVFPYVPTYELIKDTPFYNRHNYLPTKNNKLDVTELFYLATIDYNILETPIDDILFMNNTLNACYCWFKNNQNINIYLNWYTLSYYELIYILYKIFINPINLEGSLKLLYIQGKIIDLLTPDYKQINKQLYLNYINKKILDKKNLFENYIKTKNDYDNILQFFLNDQNKYRKYIIKVCENAYYFMPINYLSFKGNVKNNSFVVTSNIDYEQFKDIQTNINLKIINDMIMFYNKHIHDDVKNDDETQSEYENSTNYFELYTYFYKFMITILSDLEINKSSKIISFNFNSLKKYFDDYFKNKNYNSNNDKLFNKSIIYLFLCLKLIYEIKYNNKKEMSKLKDIFKIDSITNLPKNEIKLEYKYNIDCIKEIYEDFIKGLNKVIEFCYNHNYKIEVKDGETYNIIDKITNSVDNSKLLDISSSKYIFNDNINKINGYLYHTYWGEFFSMYYLEQFNIFNKYLNNRIIYATGATGTGKSTQLPKLLLYAGSVLDNNPYYHILCSQPRQRPTKENAIVISKQSSTPILPENFDPKNNKLEYYLQFKHGEDKKHYFNNPKYPVLMFATDKIVYQNVCNNPLCCSYKIDTKTNILPQIKEVYNMIIVDEAHEHNVNMDFILSIMKYYCHHNNRIKLVIISATMDADEDKYRRFYDSVNDMIYDHTIKTIYNEEFLENRKIINPKTNKIYTYTELMDDNLELSNDNKQKLYQVVDRRLDISEPNKTTVYKIIDIYKNMTSDELKDENLKDKMVSDIIFEILKDKGAKDILVFKTGQKPIVKLVNEINQKLPSDTIALPYYSALNKDVKEFIEHLNEYHKQIDIDKSIDVSQLKSTEKFINGGPPYKHYILIATNIAEASITIPSLTHVIDDGVQNVSKFDYKFESTGLSIGYIANTNRLQRRGRVGRKANGTVYYLYKEGALDGETQEYNICNSNIVPDLVELFTNNTLKNELITKNNELNEKFNQRDLINSIKKVNYLLFNIIIDNPIKDGLLNIPLNNLQIRNVKKKEQIIDNLVNFKNCIDYINEYCINGNIDLEFDNNVIKYKTLFKNVKTTEIIECFKIIENKLLLYPNLSLDDFIEWFETNDKNKIIWSESYYLNKKYSGYLKVEDEKNYDNLKKLYENNKIILMSSLCATHADEDEKINIQTEETIITGGMMRNNKFNNESESVNDSENYSENYSENNIYSKYIGGNNKLENNCNQYFDNSDSDLFGGIKSSKPIKKSSKDKTFNKKSKSFNNKISKQINIPKDMLNQYQKNDYLIYKCGFYYNVLLDIQYNFFNISPNETDKSMIRDIFGNIIFANETMSNNMKKYLLNTYSNLNIIKYSLNNNQIIHTDEYELIKSLMLKLDSHYEFLPQIIIGLCLAQANNCINLYLIYAAIILNYDEYLSKIKLDRNIKFDSELQYYVDLYINKSMKINKNNSLKYYNKQNTYKEMDDHIYKKISKTIDAFNKIITNNEDNTNKEYDIFKDLVVKYKDFVYLDKIPSETEKIKFILICIFRNKLIVNLPSEYLKVIHPIRKNPNIIIGPNSSIPMYIYKNIYTSISNPSQNIIKRYNDNNNCNEHDFVLYLSDKIENDVLNKYVVVSLTIPFDPNYLKYLYINKDHLLNQLNKPIIDIYYRKCLEMLLKYIN